MRHLPSLFFAISCLLTACNPTTDDQRKQTTNITVVQSHLIPLDSANKMIRSYLGSLDSTVTVADLRSAVFDAAQLRRYLSDTTISQVKISLAHKLQYINAGNRNLPAGYRSDALTFIISASDASGNYVLPGNQVMDYAMQCPILCPAGTAGNSLFPVTSTSNE